MFSNGQVLLDDDYDIEMDDYESVSDLEDFLSYLEDEEDDGEDDSERRRRPRRGLPRRSQLPSKRLSRKPSSSNAALAAAINKNSASIKAVDAKVNGLNARVVTVQNEQKRQMALLKKDRMARQKEMTDLKSKLQLLVLLPLLTSGSENSSLGLLLPLLILGDLGGSSSKGGSDMNMLLLVLALSGGLGGKK